MDRDGFLAPPGVLKCEKCGKGLNADKNHPAESYAGTATGLCYACEGAGAFPTGKVLLSGAIEYSHPPHSPSWRRDRETFYGFEDCPKCKGHGMFMVYRSAPLCGSLDRTACSRRHHRRLWRW